MTITRTTFTNTRITITTVAIMATTIFNQFWHRDVWVLWGCSCC